MTPCLKQNVIHSAILDTGTKFKGGMGGDSPPPLNSRFRRAQGKFAGQKCGI